MSQNKKHALQMHYEPKTTQPNIKQGKYFIIDCDPGADDIHALMLANSLSKELNIDILGITISYGNTSLQNASKNAKIALKLLNWEIPLYEGSQHSLLQDFHQDGYFGDDGISNHQHRFKDIELCDTNELHAIDFIEKMGKKYPEELNIICLGPCTNLALAVLKSPQLKSQIQNVFIMGGTHLSQGNTKNFVSEFNAYNDPHAFHLVTKSFQQIVMLTFDAIFNMQPQEQDYDQIFQHDSPIGQILQKFYQNPSKFGPIYLCDPITVAIAFNVNIIQKHYLKHCKIELEGQLTKGQVVVDWLNMSKQDPNIIIPLEVDTDYLFKALKDIFFIRIDQSIKID